VHRCRRQIRSAQVAAANPAINNGVGAIRCARWQNESGVTLLENVVLECSGTAYDLDNGADWVLIGNAAYHNAGIAFLLHADTFTATTIDGTQQLVTITINGANDAAVITGTATGAVIEAGGVANGTPGTPTATGNLDSTDVDNPPDGELATPALCDTLDSILTVYGGGLVQDRGETCRSDTTEEPRPPRGA